MSIYVETFIRADLDDLWDKTQSAQLHQRWDLRFSTIEDLPDGHFRYTFLTILGTGVHAGERKRPDGTCTSALRFDSPHPLSPIRSGSGYWRYLPTDGGIRFLTGYDYRPRGWFDAVVRPLIGWATAWSFDRLRIWLETGRTPEQSLRRALAELLLRLAVVTTALLATPLLAGLAITLCALLLPPLPSTPAARRCLRHPPLEQ